MVTLEIVSGPTLDTLTACAGELKTSMLLNKPDILILGEENGSVGELGG